VQKYSVKMLNLEVFSVVLVDFSKSME